MSEDPEVLLHRFSRGIALVSVTLPSKLDGAGALHARGLVEAKIAELGGEPFSLLIDTRAILEAETGALAHLKELEVIAARSGRLERLAHLVRSAELARTSAEQLKQAGFPELFRDFTEATEALQYLLGTSADDPPPS